MNHFLEYIVSPDYVVRWTVSSMLSCICLGRRTVSSLTPDNTATFLNGWPSFHLCIFIIRVTYTYNIHFLIHICEPLLSKDFKFAFSLKYIFIFTYMFCIFIISTYKCVMYMPNFINKKYLGSKCTQHLKFIIIIIF